MGGYVALNTAHISPGLINFIVTLAAKFNWTPDVATEEIKMLRPEVIEDKVTKFAEVLSNRHGTDRWRELCVETAQMMTYRGEGPTLTPSSLGEIETDVRLFVGSADRMISLEETKWAGSYLPKSEVTVLNEVKHPIEKFPKDHIRTLFV